MYLFKQTLRMNNFISAGKPRYRNTNLSSKVSSAIYMYICAVWTGRKYGRRHGPCK